MNEQILMNPDGDVINGEVGVVCCDLVDIDELQGFVAPRGSLSILNVNIRSCRKNFSSLESLLSLCNFSFDIIVFTETWLTKATDFTYHLLGYNKFSVYRDGRGGGVSAYVTKSLNSVLIDQLTIISDSTEILSLKIYNDNINFILIK